MTAYARGADSAVALVEADSGRSLTYAALAAATEKEAAVFGAEPSLVFHCAAHTLDAVVSFLAARSSGHAVALIDPRLRPDHLSNLLARYRPRVVTAASDLRGDGYTQIAPGTWLRDSADTPAPHPDLGILLSTSGSTGSPKFVRLSAAASEHNAGAIADSLGITAADHGLTVLPLHYSYGLSVLTSHLAAGATTVISDASVIEPRFWDQFDRYGVTSLAGVPYTFQMLRRVGFLDRALPTLRYMTQAGGRMAQRDIAEFAGHLEARAARLFVMYGQTEAGPRMSCLNSHDLTARPASVGRALRDGAFRIEAEDGSTATAGQVGEVIYSGPNVMMGYAEGADDVTAPDECGGILRTGDLGYLDDADFLFVTGRAKRIGKVFGVRVSLDDVQEMVTGLGAVAVVAGDDRLDIHHESGDSDTVRAVRKQLSLDLAVPTQALNFRHTDPLPMLTSGKPDYQALRGLRP